MMKASLHSLADRMRTQIAAPVQLDRPPLAVLITIDSEVSLGGAVRNTGVWPVGVGPRIWGDWPGGAAGVGLMMDIFDAAGVIGVFFLEVEGRHLVGEEDLAAVAAHIHRRGHRVELHMHPEFRMDLADVRIQDAPEPSPNMYDYSIEVQAARIREGAALIEAWTGRRPVAFRAGSYAGDRSTVEAVRRAGLTVESSYNRWGVKHGDSGFPPELLLNDLCRVEGVLEQPISCYRAPAPHGGLRQLDLAGMTATEAIWAVEAQYAAGARTACAIHHSFRLLRTTDVQYTDARPDRVNIHRLKTFCDYLAAHQDRFQVIGFEDLEALDAGPLPPVHELATAPRVAAWPRLLMQGLKDRGVV